MTIRFPIQFDVHQFGFGLMLASMHHRPELVGALRAAYPQIQGGESEDSTRLQEHLYRSTLHDLLRERTKLGKDIYAATWFVLGFHGWLAIAKLDSLSGPSWLPDMDHVGVLADALFELGVETNHKAIGEALRDTPTIKGGDIFKKIESRLLYFSGQIQYLSSAAIRGGHRIGLNVPAASAFISYAHEDVELVNGMANFLEKHAVNIWLDSDDLRSAAELDGRLSAGIKRQEVFVVVLTDASLRSKWVMFELGQAINLGKRLLPLSLVPADMLGALRNHEGGMALYERVMAFPVVRCQKNHGWLDAYRIVLQNLQKIELDLTRWRLDEGNALATIVGKDGSL